MGEVLLTSAGTTSQSSHPHFNRCSIRVRNRAATITMHTAGNIVATVYNSGGSMCIEDMMATVAAAPKRQSWDCIVGLRANS